MVWMYNAGIWIARKLLPMLALVNPMIKRWWQGRKNQIYPTIKAPIWFHCASLGEFEQGRPVIEEIKRQWPNQAVVLTFFSASGYEVRKDYSQVDWVGYLPIDTPSEAARFIQTIQPKVAVFVKYEYWYHHLIALQRAQIPYIFISAAWRPDNFLLKPWTRWLLKVVRGADAFYVQDQQTKDLLLHHEFKNIYVVGDTRIDRVMDIAKDAYDLPYIAQLAATAPILVAGSTWAPDEVLIAAALPSLTSHTLIITPHDTSSQRISEVKALFSPHYPVLYSEWDGSFPCKVLIIDRVGLLNQLYRYAQVAYVGGGFGKGIHNTLEPAVYGIPIFFGPAIGRFREAKEMVAMSTAFIVESPEEWLKKWQEIIPSQLAEIKVKLSKYFNDNQGATAKIIDYLHAFEKL